MPGKTPPGIRLIRTLRGRTEADQHSLRTYQFSILILTFIAYAVCHASRKPPSIVKSVLVHSKNRPGWAPFDGSGGTGKLGILDLAFLVMYSIGMYVAGRLGDRLDLRVFLAAGMVVSGVFVAAFGMGYFLDLHHFAFYLVIQMVGGLIQASSWPSVVAIVGNWCSQRKRGFIMGVWNAHTSVGNICGSLLAACVLQHGWGWSFVLPGLLTVATGVVMYFFLAAYPEDIGFPRQDRVPELDSGGQVENPTGQEGSNVREGGGVVGIIEALKIPGLIPFAMCLFFSKFVAYTFLYWLPFYLTQTEIGGEHMSVKSAGNLSTLFDVGGIVGGILAGVLSDVLNARACTAAVFLYLAIFALYIYHTFGKASLFINILLMMVAGLFVNAPYALISTAVAADLGTHNSLRGNSRALATVTAFIDGTGSIGAALGPLFTGFVSKKGWRYVFLMLMVGALFAALILSPIVILEIQQIIERRRPARRENEANSSEILIRDES